MPRIDGNSLSDCVNKRKDDVYLLAPYRLNTILKAHVCADALVGMMVDVDHCYLEDICYQYQYYLWNIGCLNCGCEWNRMRMLSLAVEDWYPFNPQDLKSSLAPITKPKILAFLSTRFSNHARKKKSSSGPLYGSPHIEPDTFYPEEITSFMTISRARTVYGRLALLVHTMERAFPAFMTVTKGAVPNYSPSGFCDAEEYIYWIAREESIGLIIWGLIFYNRIGYPFHITYTHKHA